MTTQAQKNLIVSVIQMIRTDISSGRLSADQAESLEVAIQTLETGYGLTDGDYAFQPSRPLLDTFKQVENLGDDAQVHVASDADKAQAERLKNEGNLMMQEQKYTEAVLKYSEAIKLFRHAPFFCNRAAAYGKLDQHDLTIQDCRIALALDPQYAKAYARMGLALSTQERYQEAVDAYRTALELDPTNDSYKNNLDVAEKRVAAEAQARQQQGQQAGFANPFAAMMGGSGAAGGNPLDLTSILNNPAMINMATQMMSDPNMQNFMTNMMGSLMQNPGGAQGMDGLLGVGQRLAEQIQQQNPDLVNQLRNQMQDGGSSHGASDSATRPPSDNTKPPGGDGSSKP